MNAVTLIEIPAWGNMNLIEFIWTLTGAVTMLYTLSHVRELVRDLTSVSRNTVLRVVAWGYLRREVIRFCQGGCITSIGIYAAIQASALPQGDVTTYTGIVLTSVLFLMGMLVSGQSFWDWQTRMEIIRLLHQQAAGQAPVQQAAPSEP